MDLTDIFTRYPGIGRILTPENIAAYDRGEYDDLDALPVMELIGATSRLIVKERNWAAGKSHSVLPLGLRRKVRQYEAELISRYKAGLL